MSERYEHSEAGAEGQEAIVEAAERSKELLNEAKREASRAESEDAAAKLKESRKAIDEAAETAAIMKVIENETKCFFDINSSDKIPDNHTDSICNCST